MILLDTSILVVGLTGPKRSRFELRAAIDTGECYLLPSRLRLARFTTGSRFGR